MTELTINIPEDLYHKLQVKAAAQGTSLDEIIINSLQADAEKMSLPLEEEIDKILLDLGMISPLSHELRQLIIPGVTHEGVKSALAQTGGKTLTEILLEQRGKL